jgi:hypothetical protein
MFNQKEAEMPHEWVNYKSLRAELSFIELLHHYGAELKERGEQWQGFCPLPTHEGKRQRRRPGNVADSDRDGRAELLGLGRSSGFRTFTLGAGGGVEVAKTNVRNDLHFRNFSHYDSLQNGSHLKRAGVRNCNSWATKRGSVYENIKSQNLIECFTGAKRGGVDTFGSGGLLGRILRG